MTSFFAQELLNELLVSALTGAELVLAGAKLINRRVKLISKLSHHGTQVGISRQALRGRR